MRYLAFYLALLAATGCAGNRSGSQPAHRPSPSLPTPPGAGLRYPEILGVYHVGRHVDDTQGRLMHEAHPVYRIEVDPRWDLHPDLHVRDVERIGRQATPPDSAWAPPPVGDEIVAEINLQKAATARVTAEAARLAGAYDTLQELLEGMSRVVKVEYPELRLQILELQRKLDALEGTPPPPKDPPVPESLPDTQGVPRSMIPDPFSREGPE